MRPGQVEPNEFEIAILERLAQKRPGLQPAIRRLRVLSREFTGVGCYTNFLCEEFVPELGNDMLGLDELISMPNVPNGMGAVLHCEDGKPKFLETFTYGDDHWDGVYTEFTIDPS